MHVTVGSEQLAAMSLSMRGTDISSEAITQDTVDGRDFDQDFDPDDDSDCEWLRGANVNKTPSAPTLFSSRVCLSRRGAAKQRQG